MFGMTAESNEFATVLIGSYYSHNDSHKAHIDNFLDHSLYLLMVTGIV